MFAIRARRKVASERDFLDAVEKVVRQGTKFSSTFVSFFLRSHVEMLSFISADRYIKYTIRIRHRYIFRLISLGQRATAASMPDNTMLGLLYCIDTVRRTGTVTNRNCYAVT